MKEKLIIGSVGIATLGAVCISCHFNGINGTVTTAIVSSITAILGAMLGISIGKVKK